MVWLALLEPVQNLLAHRLNRPFSVQLRQTCSEYIQYSCAFFLAGRKNSGPSSAPGDFKQALRTPPETLPGPSSTTAPPACPVQAVGARPGQGSGKRRPLSYLSKKRTIFLLKFSLCPKNIRAVSGVSSKTGLITFSYSYFVESAHAGGKRGLFSLDMKYLFISTLILNYLIQ